MRPLSRTDTIALRSRAIEAACAFYSDNYMPPLPELANQIAFFERILLDGAALVATALAVPPVEVAPKFKLNVVSVT